MMMVLAYLFLLIYGLFLFSVFVFNNNNKNNHGGGGNDQNEGKEKRKKKEGAKGGKKKKIEKINVGSQDPSEIQDKHQHKTNKQVEPKSDKKTEKEKPDDKRQIRKPPLTTMVLKMNRHCNCDGCTNGTKVVASKFEGMTNMSMDDEKVLLTVNSSVDVEVLTKRLMKKLNRRVEIVPLEKGKKEKESNNIVNGVDGADKNTKKGLKSECHNNGDGGNKAEGYGDENLIDIQIDYIGLPGFTYKYGYHSRYDYRYPVREFHAPC